MGCKKPKSQLSLGAYRKRVPCDPPGKHPVTAAIFQFGPKRKDRMTATVTYSASANVAASVPDK